MAAFKTVTVNAVWEVLVRKIIADANNYSSQSGFLQGKIYFSAVFMKSYT